MLCPSEAEAVVCCLFGGFLCPCFSPEEGIQLLELGVSVYCRFSSSALRALVCPRQRWMFPHMISQPVSPLCSLPGDTGSSPIPGLCPTSLGSLSSPCSCSLGTSQTAQPTLGLVAQCPQPSHCPQGCLCSLSCSQKAWSSILHSGRKGGLHGS